MSHSGRFLVGTLMVWVAVRAVGLGLTPGSKAFASETEAAGGTHALPPLAETQFAPLDPVAPSPVAPVAATMPPYPMPPGYYPMVASAPRSPAMVVMRASAPIQREPRFGDVGEWGLGEQMPFRFSSAAMPIEPWPGARSRPASSGTIQTTPAQSTALVRPAIDRLSMSAWAMLRRTPGPASLAANGMLGGSQGGARILWRFSPTLAASIRTSAPIGGVSRVGEVAAGVRWQPFQRIPVALTAERRQAFGRDAGRSTFALFAEGGIYQRPIVAGFNLDAYLQGGVVGPRRRALFVDGSATLTRPVWRQVSAGVGLWGGAQPGLYRIDVGPRVTMKVGRSMRVHLDYRQRLAGSAAPGSGPVLTLAGDF